MLSLEIESRHYDFVGMTEHIIQYCAKNQIPARLSARIQLVFEELIQNLLIPAVKNPAARVTAEYSQENEQAEMTVLYNGPAQDLTAQGDELTLSVLKGAAAEIRYSQPDGGDLPNRLVVTIREK